MVVKWVPGILFINGLTAIIACMNNCTDGFIWDVIAHPCTNSNGGLTKPPLKLGHGWVFTPHCFTWSFRWPLLAAYCYFKPCYNGNPQQYVNITFEFLVLGGLYPGWWTVTQSFNLTWRWDISNIIYESQMVWTKWLDTSWVELGDTLFVLKTSYCPGQCGLIGTCFR